MDRFIYRDYLVNRHFFLFSEVLPHVPSPCMLVWALSLETTAKRGVRQLILPPLPSRDITHICHRGESPVRLLLF